MPIPTDSPKSAGLSPEIFAICLLLTASLQIIENMLPKIPIFPWLRFGLGYLIILPFLLRFGMKNTVILFLCRNLVTLIYGGQIFSAFLISSISGTLTLSVMGSIGLKAYRSRIIGLMGLSILLAVTFNLTQLTAVYWLYIQHGGFFFQITPILIWSLVSGGIVAFLIIRSETGLAHLFDPGIEITLFPATSKENGLSNSQKWMLCLAVAGFILILLVKWTWLQLVFAGSLLLITRLKSAKTILYAWPFFFYIAWRHLFHTDGVYVVKDWITREGIAHFIFYSIRTVNLILCGQWLARYIPALIERWQANQLLRGMTYAIPLLPALFGISISMGRTFFRQVRKREFDNLIGPIIETMKKELETVSAIST